jgi:hypothetical protein
MLKAFHYFKSDRECGLPKTRTAAFSTFGNELVILVICEKPRWPMPKLTYRSSSTLPNIVVSASSFSGMASPLR